MFSPFLILCMQMSNFSLKNFHLHSAQVMWCLILPMEWSTTYTQADTPQFLKKPAALTQKNLKLPKQNSKVWNPPLLSAFNITMDVPFAHGSQGMGLGSLVARPCTVAQFKKKINLVKDYHQIPVAAEACPKTAIITILACLNICSPLLGCPMPRRYFNA
jgi:hypothetical protein